MTEAEADPQLGHAIELADAIPPMNQWDPELRRQVRALLRKPGG